MLHAHSGETVTHARRYLSNSLDSGLRGRLFGGDILYTNDKHVWRRQILLLSVINTQMSKRTQTAFYTLTTTKPSYSILNNILWNHHDVKIYLLPN